VTPAAITGRILCSVTSYEIRVRGRVTDALLPLFEDCSARVEPVDTVLQADLPDQAALHGVLDRIASLGLELVEVRRGHVASAAPHPPAA
jgi:hypothetical protein